MLLSSLQTINKFKIHLANLKHPVSSFSYYNSKDSKVIIYKKQQQSEILK